MILLLLSDLNSLSKTGFLNPFFQELHDVGSKITCFMLGMGAERQVALKFLVWY